MQEIFAAARITISLGFLLYASWSDYKTREVSNRVWAIYAPIAFALSTAEFLFFYPARLPFFGLSVGITCIIALALFYTGGFGGADSKALMCIAIALPFSTETVFPPLLHNGVSPLSQILFPITIFSNGVLFAAATAIYLLLHNVIWHQKSGLAFFEGSLAHQPLGKKLLTMITGHKTSINKLKEKWHIYPMEDIESEESENAEKQLERRLVTIPRDEGREEIVERLSKAVNSGKINPYVWATPGLPMLIFITIGLVASLLLGDIVWILVTSLLG